MSLNGGNEESMTTIGTMRLASLVTAINVLVASGFSIAAIIRPQYLVPAEPVRTEASLLLAMYAAAPRIPLTRWYWELSTSTRSLRCWSWVRSPAPCNCLMPESVWLRMILENAMGHSLSLSSNSSWCICFTNPCGSPVWRGCPQHMTTNFLET